MTEDRTKQRHTLRCMLFQFLLGSSGVLGLSGPDEQERILLKIQEAHNGCTNLSVIN